MEEHKGLDADEQGGELVRQRGAACDQRLQVAQIRLLCGRQLPQHRQSPFCWRAAGSWSLRTARLPVREPRARHKGGQSCARSARSEDEGARDADDDDEHAEREHRPDGARPDLRTCVTSTA